MTKNLAGTAVVIGVMAAAVPARAQAPPVGQGRPVDASRTHERPRAGVPPRAMAALKEALLAHPPDSSYRIGARTVLDYRLGVQLPGPRIEARWTRCSEGGWVGDCSAEPGSLRDPSLIEILYTEPHPSQPGWTGMVWEARLRPDGAVEALRIRIDPDSLAFFDMEPGGPYAEVASWVLADQIVSVIEKLLRANP